jgi:hypothetical protein
MCMGSRIVDLSCKIVAGKVPSCVPIIRDIPVLENKLKDNEIHSQVDMRSWYFAKIMSKAFCRTTLLVYFSHPCSSPNLGNSVLIFRQDEKHRLC